MNSTLKNTALRVYQLSIKAEAMANLAKEGWAQLAEPE